MKKVDLILLLERRPKRTYSFFQQKKHLSKTKILKKGGEVETQKAKKVELTLK